MNDAKEMLDKYQYAREVVADKAFLLGSEKINDIVIEKFGRGIGKAKISEMKDEYLMKQSVNDIPPMDIPRYQLRKAGYTRVEVCNIIAKGLWMIDAKKGFMFDMENWRKLMSDKNKNMQGEEL